ncbi:MAG: orotate phosphoribosyltransferase [Pseudomonadota bacterium]
MTTPPEVRADVRAGIARDFVRWALAQQVLQFGEFELKSGRRSPYFFNMGMIRDAAGLASLGEAYADALAVQDWQPDVVFGPAYKGIPIAVAAATALVQRGGPNLGVAYNRKEAKTHGEGGALVGAALEGQRVAILDDVLTAGTAVREALAIVRAAGGIPVGVLIALDRRERLEGGVTAVEALGTEAGLAVASIATIEDVIRVLDDGQGHSEALQSLSDYHSEHCVALTTAE